MASDDFELVYTILNEPINDSWRDIWFSVCGLILYLYSRFINKRRSRIMGQYIGAIVGIGFGLTSILTPLKSSFDLSVIKKQYQNNEFRIVEGTVSHFVPMPFDGHQRESFVVNGIKFSYTDYDDSYYGFNNTKSHGGPIDRDIFVRIGYITEDEENRIWKIEIKR